MALAILAGRDEAEQIRFKWFTTSWRNALLSLNPELDIRVWPDIGDPDQIDFLLAWKHQLGTLKQFTHARAIQSLAAGVDHIFIDPEITPDIPILRITDPYMANDI